LVFSREGPVRERIRKGYRWACESGCGDQPDQGFDKIILETFGQRQALVLSLTGRFAAGGCALRRPALSS